MALALWDGSSALLVTLLGPSCKMHELCAMTEECLGWDG